MIASQWAIIRMVSTSWSMRIYHKVLSDRREKACGIGSNNQLVTQIIIGSKKDQVILGEVHTVYDDVSRRYTVMYVRRGNHDAAGLVLESVGDDDMRGIVAYPTGREVDEAIDRIIE